MDFEIAPTILEVLVNRVRLGNPKKRYTHKCFLGVDYASDR